MIDSETESLKSLSFGMPSLSQYQKGYICSLIGLIGVNSFGTGSANLSSESITLWSGILAVISVNVVIVFYIITAMKEPSHKHEPDSRFLAEAKASIKQRVDSSSDRSKED